MTDLADRLQDTAAQQGTRSARAAAAHQGLREGAAVSLFTVQAKSAQTACPRCKSAQFTRLVKRGELHDIFNCGKCLTRNDPMDRQPHPAVTEADLQNMLQHQLDALIQKCEDFGYVVDVEHRPVMPLRMQAYKTIGTIRPLPKPTIT